MTPKRVMWVDENYTDLRVVELRTFFLCLCLFLPPSLARSLFLSFLFLFCFLSFLPGSSKIQLHYTISLCHRFIAVLSQMDERLSDCPRSRGVYFFSHREEGAY